MNKIVIMPLVSIYKDIFDLKEIEKFLEIIKHSETDSSNIKTTLPEESTRSENHGEYPKEREDDSPINYWVKWYNFGTKTVINMKDRPKKINDKDIEFLYDFRNKIYDLIIKIFEDYKVDWEKNEGWPDYVDDWTLESPLIDRKKRRRMRLSVTEVLKHSIYPQKEFAITFHTDTHGHRIEKPGDKQLITFTIYLNDNYDGGEIQFINEKENKLITYKPKVGDVTVFPSGKPYWHSALSVKNGDNKIFLRVFAMWDHRGSSEWFDGIKQYGLEEWLKINEDEVQKRVDLGLNDRQVIRHNESEKKYPPALPIYIKEEDEIYIDGRDL